MFKRKNDGISILDESQKILILATLAGNSAITDEQRQGLHEQIEVLTGTVRDEMRRRLVKTAKVVVGVAVVGSIVAGALYVYENRVESDDSDEETNSADNQEQEE